MIEIFLDLLPHIIYMLQLRSTVLDGVMSTDSDTTDLKVFNKVLKQFILLTSF